MQIWVKRFPSPVGAFRSQRGAAAVTHHGVKRGSSQMPWTVPIVGLELAPGPPLLLFVLDIHFFPFPNYAA